MYNASLLILIPNSIDIINESFELPYLNTIYMIYKVCEFTLHHNYKRVF